MEVNNILTILFQTIVVSGLATGLVVIFVTKWLEAKLNKQLENYRLMLNAQFGRITKIHEKEFEVLAESWKLLQDALVQIGSLTGPQEAYPDLNLYNDSKLTEFAIRIGLAESFQQELMASNDKNKWYAEWIFRNKLIQTTMAVNSLHNYLNYNRIFLDKNVVKLFDVIDNKLRNAIGEQKVGRRVNNYELEINYYLNTRIEVEKLVKELEAEIQQHLHCNEAQTVWK